MPPKVLQIIFKMQSQGSNIQRMFGCSRTGLCGIRWFVFFEFLTPSTLGGHNFLNSIPFFMIFNAPYTPIGGVQVLFRYQKQKSPPLGSCLH
jgi:hypothetical protein